MRTRILAVLAVCCIQSGLAFGDTLYDNNFAAGYGNTAWPISSPYYVSNSFTLDAASQVTGFNLYTWTTYGDSPWMVDWYITANPLDPTTTYGMGTAYLSSDLQTYSYYSYYSSSFSIPTLSLDAGTYWLQLGNASTRFGYPIYWAQSSGPSEAFLYSTTGGTTTALTPGGTSDCKNPGSTGYCSETFQVLGTTTNTAVPEPASLLLLATGVLPVWWRRRRS